MVQRDVASRKIASALAHLAEAEPAFLLPRKDFLARRKERDLAIFYLFLAIQECIDLAAHWIADEGLSPADDYAGSFRTLADGGRIDISLADGMVAATGLRNLIVHGYAGVDPSRVHDEAPEGIAALRRFLDQVARAAGL